MDILEAMPGSPKTTGAHSVFHCKPHDGTDAYEKLDKDLMGYLQMPRPQLIGSYQVALTLTLTLSPTLTLTLTLTLT